MCGARFGNRRPRPYLHRERISARGDNPLDVAPDLATRGKWDGAAAKYDLLARGAEARWADYKTNFFAPMRGKVLFLAAGTGLDFQFFPPEPRRYGHRYQPEDAREGRPARQAIRRQDRPQGSGRPRPQLPRRDVRSGFHGVHILLGPEPRARAGTITPGSQAGRPTAHVRAHRQPLVPVQPHAELDDAGQPARPARS